MKRLLLLVAAVAALVGLAAAYLPSNAASVNGSQVSQSTLNADLSAIAASPGFQCYLFADQALTQGTTTKMFPVHGAGSSSSITNPSSINTGFSRYWLSQLLSNQLVAQLVAQLHLTVTPADVALGRVTFNEQISGVLSDYESASGGSGCGTTSAAVVASMPASFLTEQAQVQANQDVLLAHEAGYSLGTAGLNRYFTVHPVKFETICYSLVPFATKTEAATARTSLASGTSFTKLGTVHSTCAVRVGLPSSVASLAVGKVSSPIELSGGEYALVQVTGVKHSTFAVVKTDVESAVLAAGEARTTALIRAANRRAEVTADPRYGRVAPATVALLAPSNPTTAFVLNPSANQPASAAS